MPSGLALFPLARPGGAGSGGHGFYDLRSWLVTSGILALLVGFGWLLRRPVRRRRQNDPRPITNKPTPGSPAPRDSHETPRGQPIGPDDDDEDFLTHLERRLPPRGGHGSGPPSSPGD